MFIHSRSSLENHTRFQTKMAKVYTYTRFQTKTGQEPYPMGRHIPNPPPPPPPIADTASRRILASERQSVINFWAIKLAQEFFFLCLVTLEWRTRPPEVSLSEDNTQSQKDSFHVSIQKTNKIFISSMLSRPYGTCFWITWQSYGLDQYSGLIWCSL